jgi:murein DD-endopeptidase MepM/ murein hydrolase activator NlpD
MAGSSNFYKTVLPLLLVIAVSSFLLGYIVGSTNRISSSDNTNQAVLSRETPPPAPISTVTPEEAAPQPSVTPSPAFTPTPSITPFETPTPQVSSVELPADALMIPVAGIKRENLSDTFNQARSEGRTHESIDIMAPRGTPVLATADGEIARFFDSERGGITIYQYSSDKKLIYYYAHLERRAENLKPGDFVRRGTVIGYVGDTGNSGAGNYHLHFSIWAIEDPKRYWEGKNINPYPLLK